MKHTTLIIMILLVINLNANAKNPYNISDKEKLSVITNYFVQKEFDVSKPIYPNKPNKPKIKKVNAVPILANSHGKIN